MEQLLARFDSQKDPEKEPMSPSTCSHRKPQRNEARFVHADLRTQMYRILGVDLTQVPGLQSTSIHSLFSELGRDFTRACAGTRLSPAPSTSPPGWACVPTIASAAERCSQ